MDSNYLKRMRALSRQVYLAFAIALLLCLSMPGALAANDPSASMTVVTLEQYEAELDRVSSVVSKFPDDASGIIALRDAIPSGWVVTGDGERFEVSAGWLKASLTNLQSNFTDWKKQCEGSAIELRNLCHENDEDELFKAVKKRCGDSTGPLQKLCRGNNEIEIRKGIRKQCEDAGGEPKTVCDDYDILFGLSAWKGQCFELSGQLHKMHDDAESLAETAQPPAEAAARAKLAHILSGREFQGMKSGDTWLSRMWDQIQRWISWILNNTIGRLLDNGPARKLVLWLLIGGVFLVIAVWVVRILSRMARTEALRVNGAFLPGRNWREWGQEALAAARAGDYRTALHSAYWAGVYRLADSGAWRLDQARTPREYLRLLKNPPGRHADISSAVSGAESGRVSALAALTRSMESAWYGYIPATQQDFESAIDQLETLGCKLRSTAQTANS